MKNVCFLIVSTWLFATSLQADSSSLLLRGDFDLSTNAPSITIYHADNTVVSVGLDWTNSRPVTNGEIWRVDYPSTDCQTNSTYSNASPVVLVGTVVNVDSDGTNTLGFQMRLPVGFSGATWVFYINPAAAYSMSYRLIELSACVPTPDSLPLSRLSPWGYIGNNYTFWGAIDLPFRDTIDMSIGSDFGLILRANRSVYGFALTTNAMTRGQLDWPDDLTNIVQVACGNRHSMALRGDGTVVGWGDSNNGQRNGPTNLAGIQSIACGRDHNLAVTTNGTVIAWGSALYGCTNVPSNLSNVVQVAAGSYTSAALKSDGTVSVWGDSSYGVTNVPSSVTNAVRVTAGGRHVAALRGDGTVIIWGAELESPADANVIYMMSTDRGCWIVRSDNTVSQIGSDDAVTMPWMVTNIVMIAGRATSHAALSGPVLLDMQSRGGTNALVRWPAAAPGRLATAGNLGSSWSLMTNTVKYNGDNKHILLASVRGETNRFYRLTPDTNMVGLGLGPSLLDCAIINTNSVPNTNEPPPMMESMMFFDFDPVEQIRTEDPLLWLEIMSPWNMVPSDY